MADDPDIVSGGGDLTIRGHGIKRHPAPVDKVREYRKTATVLAAPIQDGGRVHPPEGVMAFEKGDYIVTDNPPTHAWPVRRAVFEATHEEVTSE